ncbi:MAG: pyruvate kinase [Phycisphaerae bacterium]
MTSIVATLGPASSEETTIGRLIDAGMDVARLNFAHGDYETHSRLIEAVRRAADSAPGFAAGRLPAATAHQEGIEACHRS